MKVIRKDSSVAGTQVLHSEASVLKRLRHPGIPILYDYGEDDECVCLIEEFVRGLSLQEYFLYHPVISSEQIISYMTALCDILEYLHSDSVSVLYQDLKPEHIFIREGRIMLIDYGISELLTRSCHTYRIAGTFDYMSPESKAGLSSKMNDIYALGVIARQMIGHCDSPDLSELIRLSNEALMSDPKLRPASIAEWNMSWKSLQKSEITGQSERNHLKRIAVIGSEKGIGCTHIAISLVCFLNQMSGRAIYENASGEAVCEHIYTYGKEFREKEGMIYHGSFKGVIDYYAPEKEENTPEGIFVLDCGTDRSGYAGADLIIYVISSRLWKTGNADKDMIKLNNCFPLINPTSPGLCLAFAREAGRKVYAFPLDPDPFHVTAAKKKLFLKITGRQKKCFLGERLRDLLKRRA